MGILDFFGSSSNAEASSSTSTSPSTSTPASPPHQAEKAVNPLNPNGLKPCIRPISPICNGANERCCACPETKSVRDDCFLRSTPEEAEVKCKDLIEAHKACMRGYGFKV